MRTIGRIIGNIFSLVIGALLYEITAVIMERYEKEIALFVVVIMWVLFASIIITIGLLSFRILTSGAPVCPATLMITIIVFIGYFFCRFVLKIIKFINNVR